MFSIKIMYKIVIIFITPYPTLSENIYKIVCKNIFFKNVCNCRVFRRTDTVKVAWLFFQLSSFQAFTVADLFGWVLRCTNTVKVTWWLFSFTGGGSPQVTLRALFQTRAGTWDELPTFRDLTYGSSVVLLGRKTSEVRLCIYSYTKTGNKMMVHFLINKWTRIFHVFHLHLKTKQALLVVLTSLVTRMVNIVPLGRLRK